VLVKGITIVLGSCAGVSQRESGNPRRDRSIYTPGRGMGYGLDAAYGSNAIIDSLDEKARVRGRSGLSSLSTERSAHHTW
jgi:hypothetical protein